MIIQIERTGGVTGIPLQKTIDSESLPTQKMNKLKTIIEKVNFFNLSSLYTESVERDRFQYTITIKEESQEHTVIFDEQSLPKDLQSLIKNFK